MYCSYKVKLPSATTLVKRIFWKLACFDSKKICNGKVKMIYSCGINNS